jgi:hypothetical protein
VRDALLAEGDDLPSARTCSIRASTRSRIWLRPSILSTARSRFGRRFSGPAHAVRKNNLPSSGTQFVGPRGRGGSGARLADAGMPPAW